ncbi:uncharacterized protein LOC107646428 [Arachis ipaensis]|uniref:uncharacterized protein LOC107646428 n=1 Tax=Arachis ipaensis TaxID=130454 RepID=UPI0007AF3AC0|nr:uncharacterized protein LOC107646428 [Arachis ipaensis]
MFPYGEDGYQEDIPLRESYRDDENRKRQRFLVDCFSMIKAQRLTYYRNNQTKVRSDIYKGIQDAVVRGETRASKADAMTICKKYGYLDLFITMTCNPSCQEIGRVNNPRNLKVEDRPDISCRVFKIKLDMIILDLKQGISFGVLDAEYCNKSNAIKYLFKYVNKGLDRVAIGVIKEAFSGEDAQIIDEIKQFYDCIYLSAYEAV